MLEEDQVDIDQDIMLENDFSQENIIEYCGNYLRLTREDIQEGTNTEDHLDTELAGDLGTDKNDASSLV